MKKYAPTQKYREWILMAVEDVRKLLLLHQWRVVSHFVEKIAGNRNSPLGYTAEMEADHVYLEVEVWFSRKLEEKFIAGERRYCFEDVCHELAHVITDKVYDHARPLLPRARRYALSDRNELATEMIAKAVAGLALADPALRRKYGI